jgi:hypothetical protein
MAAMSTTDTTDNASSRAAIEEGEKSVADCIVQWGFGVAA